MKTKISKMVENIVFVAGDWWNLPQDRPYGQSRVYWWEVQEALDKAARGWAVITSYLPPDLAKVLRLPAGSGRLEDYVPNRGDRVFVFKPVRTPVYAREDVMVSVVTYF